MVSHHNMVSPQNGDTRGGPPPSSDATASDSRTFLIFIYIWQEDVAKISKVPGAIRNVNPARE